MLEARTGAPKSSTGISGPQAPIRLLRVPRTRHVPGPGDVPMLDANLVTVEALLDDVLDDSMVSDAVDAAITVLRGDIADDRGDQLDRELAAVSREHTTLMKAVQDGDRLSGLLEALRALDRRRQTLEADRAAIVQHRGINASEANRVPRRAAHAGVVLARRAGR